jgi:hypothetical protein
LGGVGTPPRAAMPSARRRLGFRPGRARPPRPEAGFGRGERTTGFLRLLGRPRGRFSTKAAGASLGLKDYGGTIPVGPTAKRQVTPRWHLCRPASRSG